MSSKTPVETITHDEARANIPPVEMESVLLPEDAAPTKVAFERRNPDLDPQLVWRGKDVMDWSDLVVDAPPIYLQEQIHPKALIEDLRASRRGEREDGAPTLFDHFGLTDDDAEAEIEYYRHTRRWSNRMILGDGLAVMASLAEREGLRGKVQCIYIDPPYGIRFNSNFQWSTTSRDVKDGNLTHMTREPEQVKAFRDTWRDGIHSYLTYLRDRLTVARDLLADTGSVFVQIGAENQHLVRGLCDEIFGASNFVEFICFKTRMALGGRLLEGVFDYIIWYAKDKDSVKYRKLFYESEVEGDNHWNKFLDEAFLAHKMTRDQVQTHALLPEASRVYQLYALYPVGPFATGIYSFPYEGESFDPPKGRSWKSPPKGMTRLARSARIEQYAGGATLRYRLFLDDYPVSPRHNIWTDTAPPTDKIFVVQTAQKIIERCILMTTDPGDLVLDPTCGSGTTATVAEQWGRRWITIDTSRVALALARSRIMGARYPYYLLADSPEGLAKEAAVSRTPPSTRQTHGDIRLGFVYERVPHITLKSIANNAEIDVIWERLQPAVEAARTALNDALTGHATPFKVASGGRACKTIDFTANSTVTMPSGDEAPANGFMEWEIPREAPDGWPDAAREALKKFWDARIARQREIDASIAAKADFETLYDKPYEDRKRVRVAGPFTVEALSPHSTVSAPDEDDLGEVLDAADGKRRRDAQEADNYFEAMLENLRRAGVHQRDKADRITFESLKPWAGEYISAEGRYLEENGADGASERRAAIFIGPEYGTVTRADLVAAAREAVEGAFDILIACAFNFDARAAELGARGIPILRARMNADLHMAGDLKSGGGNLFVVFGEPDIAVEEEDDKLRVELRKLYTFRPSTGEVEATDADDIACWFIDTDYNEESFFVRHAYFPAADVPYKALKTTLKAEIDEEAWDSLKRTVSRPFARPSSGRIAVKVINHLGDEVMKVLRV